MKIYPALRYHDARAAIDWLGEAFGFTEQAVHPGEGDAIAHAELDLPRRRDRHAQLRARGGDDRWGKRAGKGWLYAATDDVDALFERAVAAGAEVVMGLTDTDYGSRDFSVRDPEGNIWSFGTYAP